MDKEKQIKQLRNTLDAWIQNHKSEIRYAYLTTHNKRLLFLVVQSSKEYNGIFEDALSDLDVRVANDPSFDKLKVNVMILPLIPPSSALAFVDYDHAIQLKIRNKK